MITGIALATGLVGDARKPPFATAPILRPEIPITATDLLRQPSNNSPLLAIDPTEKRFVALANRLDGPDFGCALQLSGDGGRSWVGAQPVPKLPEGADKCYAPDVAFDNSGKLYYLFVGLAGGGNRPMGAFVTSSTDRGRTFAAPRRILGPQRYMVRMTIDPDKGDRGRIHVVWLETSGEPSLGGLPTTTNPIMASYSDDGGQGFSKPVQVSAVDRQRVVAPAVTVGSRGELYVLYYDLEDDFRDYQGLEGPTWEGTWTLLLATSRNGGRTFGPSVVVDDSVIPPERVMLIFTMPPPSLATDQSGRVYAAWHDARNGDWDAFLRFSIDGGRSWSKVRRLNDDDVGNGRHQYLPRLAASTNGRLDAIFYDRRGNVENRGNDVFYTYSTDGAAKFSPNQKLTSVDFDSRIGPRYAVPSAVGMFDFGSRMALVAERDRTLAAWTDTRNTGRAPPAQDIFGTEIVFRKEPENLMSRRQIGIALTALGMVAMATGVHSSKRRDEDDAAWM